MAKPPSQETLPPSEENSSGQHHPEKKVQPPFRQESEQRNRQPFIDQVRESLGIPNLYHLRPQDKQEVSPSTPEIEKELQEIVDFVVEVLSEELNYEPQHLKPEFLKSERAANIPSTAAHEGYPEPQTIQDAIMHRVLVVPEKEFKKKFGKYVGSVFVLYYDCILVPESSVGQIDHLFIHELLHLLSFQDRDEQGRLWQSSFLIKEKDKPYPDRMYLMEALTESLALMLTTRWRQQQRKRRRQYQQQQKFGSITKSSPGDWQKDQQNINTTTAQYYDDGAANFDDGVANFDDADTDTDTDSQNIENQKEQPAILDQPGYLEHIVFFDQFLTITNQLAAAVQPDQEIANQYFSPMELVMFRSFLIGDVGQMEESLNFLWGDGILQDLNLPVPYQVRQMFAPRGWLRAAVPSAIRMWSDYRKFRQEMSHLIKKLKLDQSKYNNNLKKFDRHQPLSLFDDRVLLRRKRPWENIKIPGLPRI